MYLYLKKSDRNITFKRYYNGLNEKDLRNKAPTDILATDLINK